jgi:hypothetical protein
LKTECLGETPEVWYTLSIELLGDQYVHEAGVSLTKVSQYVALLAVVLMLTSTSTGYAQGTSKLDWSHWKTVGQATLKVLFFTIYDAELKSPSGKVSHHTKCAPCLLRLTYRKNIDSDEFLEITREEWTRFGMPKALMEARLKTLNQLMPSVRDGDTISFLASGTQGDLFHGSKHLGAIKGQDFVHAFLAIWLGANTRYPKIKNLLLGAH